MENLEISIWDKTSSISTVVSALITFIYTIVTYVLLKQNKRLIAQNKDMNEVTVYLKLKEDLTKDVFNEFAHYCALSKMSLKIYDDNRLTSISGVHINDDILYINKKSFKKNILGNIEDLALLYQKNILSIDIIDSGYGYQILDIGNNLEVRRVLIDNRIEYPDSYFGFSTLYELIYLRLDDKSKKRYKKNLTEKD